MSSAAGESAMPERKRVYRRFGRVPASRSATRFSYKRPRTSLSMARVRTEVKRMIERRAEHKCVTFQSPLVTDYATPTTLGLANLTIGALRNQRLGSHVIWKYLRLNFVAATGSVGGAGVIGIPSRLRCMVVYDKSTAGGAAILGAAPTIANVVIDPVASRNYYSMLNPSAVPARFDVLYDKILALNVGGGATDQALSKVWSVDLKFELKTTYTDGSNTGTVADIQRGAIWLFVTSDQTGLQVPNGAVEIDIGYLDES